MDRRFQFTLSKLFLLTAVVAVGAVVLRALLVADKFFELSLGRVELTVVGLVAVLLFGGRRPRNWRR